MPYMLTVETRELSHPVVFFVLMKSADRTNHETCTRLKVIDEGFHMGRRE